MCGKVCGSGCIFGVAGVFAHVRCSYRLDGHCANLFAVFANHYFVAGLNFRAVEKPRNADGRVAFGHCALHRYQIPCIDGLVSEGEWHDLRQNCGLF
jgi:hypothetical protein